MVGALQILSSEGGTFNEMLREISSSSGLLDESFAKMSDTSAFKLQASLNELKNSFIEIGASLAPFIDGFSNAISGVAKFIDGLGGSTKTAIGYISGLLAVMSPLIGIGGKAISGIGGLVDFLSDLDILGFKIGSNLVDGIGKSFKGEGKKKISTVTKDAFNEAFKGITISRFAEEIGEEGGEAIAKGFSVGTKSSSKIAKEAIEEVGEGMVEVGTQAAASTGIFGKLWGVISAHPIGALTTAVLALGGAWAVSAVAKQNYEKKMAKTNAFKAVEEAQQYVDNTMEIIRADQDRVKGLKEIQKEFDTLHSKGTANMNEKELARYKELCVQVAELMPEMVVGYMSDGTPILKQNQALESNIKLLELKLEREKQIAQMQAREASQKADTAFEESEKDYETKSNEVSRKKEALDTSANYGLWDKTGSVDEFYEKSEKQREKDLENQRKYTEGLKECRDEQQAIAQQRANDIEYLNGVYRNEASIYSETSDVMKNASEEQKAFNEGVISLLNFEGIDTSKRESAYKQVVETNANMSEANMKVVNDLGKQQQMLNAQVMSGEITAEEYSSQMDSIAQKYAEIYNIDVDTAKKLFCPEMDKSSMEALATDIDYTREKVDTYLKDMLNTSDNNKRIEIARQIALDPELSQDVKDRVNEMLADGVITDDEILELGTLVAEGKVDTSVLQDTLRQNLHQFGQIENMTIEMAVQFGDSVTNINELKTMIDSIDGLTAETKIELKKNIDEKDINGIKETIKDLPAEQQVGIIVAMEQTGEFTPEQLKTLYDQLPPEVQSQIQVMVNNGEIPKEIAEGIGLIPEETEAEVNVNSNGEEEVEKTNESLDKVNGKRVEGIVTVNSETEALEYAQGQLVELDGKTCIVSVNTQTGGKDLAEYKGEIEGLPKTKEIILSALDNASTIISTVIGIPIPNKLFTINCTDGASTTVDKVNGKNISDKGFSINCVDNGSGKVNYVVGLKIGDKKFTITANDKATSVIGSIKSALDGIKSKTVTITQKIKNLFSGDGKTGAAKPPQIVDPVTLQARTQPIVVDDFTATVNSASASILASANTFNNAQDNAVASIQARGYTDTISSSMGWISNSIDYNINLLEDYEAQLNRLGNELEIVSQKAELAFGNSKANLLQNEISLLQQKQQMLAHEKNEYIAMNENLKSMLSQQGFRVDGNGAVTNYANRLLELEKAVERAKDAQDAYEGDDKNRQKSLQDAYDNANERLQKAQETLSKYYDTSSKIGDTEKEWYSVQQAIRDTKNEIYETNREARNFYTDAHIKELEYAYEDLGNKIDLINSKMELGNNHEKISLLQDELVLLERQQQKNNELMNSYKQQQQYFKEFLQNRGFSFDYLGDIVNAEDKLAQYRTSDEYESIIDAYEQYMEIQSSTLPDLVNEWVDLENEQQDVKETIEEVQKEIKELNKMKTFDFLDELIDKQEKLENQLNILSSKMEVTYGSNKEQLLREQIGLLNQQQLALSNVNNELERQRQYLVMDMKQDGFQFDTNGNISNLDYLLSIAETQDKYDELKEKAEEYQDIQNEITSNNAEWHNLQSEIRDTQDEIQNLQQELREMVYESNLRQLTNEFTVLQNQLDKLENKLELNGTDASEIYKEQLKLIEKQKEATEKQIKYQQEKAKELNGTLISYGFIINDDGTIENATQRLESLKNQLSDDEFSRVNNFLEEYFEIALEEIPNLENQMLSLQKSIEDIEEEKLDKAKQIEDEITKVYEKQIEERIKAIEKERDAQVESLNKQKDAYSKWRAEIDYEEDYNEQLSKVQELQSQIDIAKKDDSLSGKKRLEDLMKQLTEEQKNLEGIVQDRTDTLINQMIDDQIENIEDRADEQIKGIEDVFNETKLSEMVANAMQTGIFEDIDGNISELDNALMEFANNSTDYLGVMGEGLKNELLDNLNVALDYMQQMEKISLDMSKIEYDTARYIGVGYQKGVVEGVISSNTTNNNDNRVINVSFNPQIEVAGGGTVDETQIMGIMDKAKSDLINEIQHQILNNMK